MGGLRQIMFAYRRGYLILPPPPSNRMPARLVGARPYRRQCGGVSWALWASWSSTPPRLDLAGQGKHFIVKEQKQQRMDKVTAARIRTRI